MKKCRDKRKIAEKYAEVDVHADAADNRQLAYNFIVLMYCLLGHIMLSVLTLMCQYYHADDLRQSLLD